MAISAAPEFQAAAGNIAREVSLREFSLRERRILAVIYEAGFGAGNANAYLPGLVYFARAAGNISEPHVSPILKHLKRCEVIEESPKDYYSFKLPTDNWKVPLQLDMLVMREVLELRFTKDEFVGAMQDTFIEGFINPDKNILPTRDGGTDSPIVRPEGGVTAREPARGSEVPESGTTPETTGAGKRHPNAVPESGTLAKTPQNPQSAAVLCPVPFSGTAAVPARDKSCSASKKQDCTAGQGSNKTDKSNKSWGVVPESGTGSTRGKLHAVEQELIDALEGLEAFGPDNSSKGNWVAFVRTRPEVTERLISALRLRMARTDLSWVKNRGAWLNDEWQRWGRPDQ